MEELLGAQGLVCEPLNDGHFLMDFETGRDDDRLAKWLNNKAHRYQAEDLCRVSILRRQQGSEDIVGYFTLSAHSVKSEDVAKRDRAAEAENGSIVGSMRVYPALLLGKFALDTQFQGQKMGELMMGCVYEQHLDIAANSGIKFLVTEAQNENLKNYYANRFGFVAASNGVAGKIPLYKSTNGIRLDMKEIHERA